MPTYRFNIISRITAPLLCSFMVLSLLSCGTPKAVQGTTTDDVQLEASIVDDQQEKELNFYDPETWLLGYVTREQMTSYPHSEWFQKGYEEYFPESISINQLLDMLDDDISIKVVMASWCSDSHKEVPRFLRILDMCHFPNDKITFIGTDIEKISPVGEYESLGIEKVPTFIVYEKKIELGRIIESPLTSLEQDMVNILLKTRYVE